MNSSRDESDAKVLELLAGSILGDLSADEFQEFSDLNWDDSRRQQLFELERTAAAVQLVSAMQSVNEMPSELRKKIATSAVNFLNGSKSGEASVELPANSVAASAAAGPENTTLRSNTSISLRETLAWLAMAASLLFAVGLLLSRGDEQRERSVASIRSELLKSADDVLELNWQNGTTPFSNPVSGDVVWSNNQQSGVMRFVGMPVNDPSKEQYQLWIIDPERDDEPIDGGVFDIQSSEESMIAIDAKLRVSKPVAFAITIEKPGAVSCSNSWYFLTPVLTPLM